MIILDKIDKEYGQMADNAEPYAIEKSKNELSRMESILGAPNTIDSLCKDMIYHYENYREFELKGKAMIVAYSRSIAMKIYKNILKLRPEWDEKVKVVMTSSNNDPEEWHDIIGNKAQKQRLANKFKDNEAPMKIAIVVDMWLTGFNIPSLDTMYVYKPMKGHTLMQAIARVNRVFKNKEGGLVVDYIGISSALKRAMSDYTKKDITNYGEMDIANVAYPKFQEKLEICQDLMHGFDYSDFFSDSDLKRGNAIAGGADFLSENSKKKKREDFIKEANLLRQALSLCRSIIKEKEHFEAGYFEAVRTLLTRFTSEGKISLKEINSRINELLKQSIKSEGVINLFSDVEDEFSIFDSGFLEDISNLPEKNISIELLKNLLNEKVRSYSKTNLVKSEQFSEKLKQTMNNYINGLISNEEVIKELKKIAIEIKKAHEKGNELGLNDEELAFYDALTKPENIKDFYENEQLIALTKELTEKLRKSRTIDWQKKNSARANMKKIVKILLKKHKYPPEGQEYALDIIIKQCELWTDNSVFSVS